MKMTEIATIAAGTTSVAMTTDIRPRLGTKRIRGTIPHRQSTIKVIEMTITKTGMVSLRIETNGHRANGDMGGIRMSDAEIVMIGSIRIEIRTNQTDILDEDNNP